MDNERNVRTPGSNPDVNEPLLDHRDDDLATYLNTLVTEITKDTPPHDVWPYKRGGTASMAGTTAPHLERNSDPLLRSTVYGRSGSEREGISTLTSTQTLKL